MSQPSVGSFRATTFQGKSYIWLQNNAMNNYDCHSFLIEIYSPEMMVFVDETGSDNKDSRMFGYALKGQRASSRRLLCSSMELRSSLIL